MKYLCQVWSSDAQFEALSAEEKSALDRNSLAYDQSLMASGHFIAADALQSPATAKTIKVRKGKALVTDGPFAETKEYLVGFILIEAEDMEDAVRIASGIPMAAVGSIEVRPIYDFS